MVASRFLGSITDKTAIFADAVGGGVGLKSGVCDAHRRLMSDITDRNGGTMASKLVSKSQAAALLGVSEKTIDRMIARDELPAMKLGGLVRIPEAAVQRILEKGASNG